MKLTCKLLAVLLLLVGCKNADVTEKIITNDSLAELYLMMQGSFSSKLQADEDSTYHHMVMNVCPIWNGKDYFLYAEMASNDSIEKPLKQRIFKLSKVNDSLYLNAMYALKGEANWINKWKSPEEFSKLKMQDLEEISGCHITLKRVRPTYFQGKTEDNGCLNNLQGAAVSISEMEIFEDKIITWDKGFDEHGSQIWGSLKGGYIFDRVF